jgi:hypothetical protein
MGELAGVLVLGGEQRCSEVDPDRAGPGPRAALRQDPARAVQVDRHDRHAAAHAQVGGAALVLLPPSVGTAPALGEDQQRPAVTEERRSAISAPATDLVALHRHGAVRPRSDGRGAAPVEEVVRGGGHRELVAPRQRDRREQQRGVEVAVVVGDEHDRARHGVESLGVADLRSARRLGDDPTDGAQRSDPAPPCRGTARPLGVVVVAEVVDAGGGLDTAGHRRRGVREAERSQARDGVGATCPDALDTRQHRRAFRVVAHGAWRALGHVSSRPTCRAAGSSHT